MTDFRPRALLSVSDKTRIVEFGRALEERGWQLLSTGGTARTLREAGVEVTEVAEVTGHPEMMEGRVKTLHPAIHAGLLARRERDDDMAALDEQGYGTIDLVAVNLYPFRETVARGDVSVAEAMEQVDVGGPTMLRAAAKNHAEVWVVVDPVDYDRVLEMLDREGKRRSGESGSDREKAEAGRGQREVRRELAAKVFHHVAVYDAAIAGFLRPGTRTGPGVLGHAVAGGGGVSGVGAAVGEGSPEGGAAFGVRFAPAAERVATLRYGENPDQPAAFYRLSGASGEAYGLGALTQHHGKELSYNNLLDLDGALLCLSPFAFAERAACCIIKHTTPAGLALGATLEDAYRRALRTDPMSSFGSVISVNRPVDGAAAEAMSELFIECLVAPAFADDAMEILTRKKNIRLLTFEGLAEPIGVEPAGDPGWAERPESEKAAARFLAAHGRLPEPRTFRSVYGGVLVQAPPNPPFYGVEGLQWEIATERAPTPEEEEDLRFGWGAVFGVKSNAILLARDGATLGIGAGQMSRVDASRIAVMKAGDAGLDLEGAALASDAFFPFRDGVDAAAEAGVRAIVQPGGSKRDPEVIEAANEHGIAMVLTGSRLFRH